MSKTSFLAIYQKLGKSPEYLVEILALQFLAEVHQYMVKNDISKADLANRASVSPAFIARLFNGSVNPSLETMAKLALAMQCRVDLHFTPLQKKAVLE